jgi:hypothetical protein
MKLTELKSVGVNLAVMSIIRRHWPWQVALVADPLDIMSEIESDESWSIDCKSCSVSLQNSGCIRKQTTNALNPRHDFFYPFSWCNINMLSEHLGSKCFVASSILFQLMRVFDFFAYMDGMPCRSLCLSLLGGRDIFVSSSAVSTFTLRHLFFCLDWVHQRAGTKDFTKLGIQQS